MYTPEIADHLANPRNTGEIDNPSGTGDVTNQVCMDRIRLTILVENGVIIDARVKAEGCPPSIAAASALTELIIDRTLEEAGMVSRSDIVRVLGRLPANKAHAAALAVEALMAALDDAGLR